MRDFRDAKAMAQTLREALSAKSVSLTHSESLELTAKVLGLRDWNALAARIASSNEPPLPNKPATSAQETGIPVIRRQSIRPTRDVRRSPWMPSFLTATPDSIGSMTMPSSR